MSAECRLWWFGAEQKQAQDEWGISWPSLAQCGSRIWGGGPERDEGSASAGFSPTPSRVQGVKESTVRAASVGAQSLKPALPSAG